MSLETLNYIVAMSPEGRILLQEGATEIGDPIWELPTTGLKYPSNVINFLVDDNRSPEIVLRYVRKLIRVIDSNIPTDDDKKWFYLDNLPPLEPISKGFIEDLHLGQGED